MAAFSLRSPTWRIFGVSLFLLLVFLQKLTSFVYCCGFFILSKEVSTSLCHSCQDHEQSYSEWHRNSPITAAGININTSSVVILCFYVPVVLVLFALLAMLLAAYAKDKTTLYVSMACQAASSSLILTGIVSFLLYHRSYLNWKDMTLCFYVYVGVPVELVISTLLTATVSKNLPSDWE